MGPVPHLHRADRASAGGRDRVAPLGLLALLRRFAWLGPALRQPRTLVVFGLSALLLAGNWLPYAWAVDQDRVLDASLGYFINPLVNVLLGHAAHERSRPAQWAAVALAAAGVLWLALGAGHVPWVSLVLVLVLVLALALSVGCYGLLRKIAPLGAIKGLALETLLLAPLAVGGLLWLGATGQGHFAQGDTRLDLRLLAAGPATAVPLLLASGARRMADGGRRTAMATLGLLQTLGPSIQCLLGVLVYHEPLSTSRGAGFVLIWAALAIYSAAGWRVMRRGCRAAAA